MRSFKFSALVPYETGRAFICEQCIAPLVSFLERTQRSLQSFAYGDLEPNFFCLELSDYASLFAAIGRCSLLHTLTMHSLPSGDGVFDEAVAPFANLSRLTHLTLPTEVHSAAFAILKTLLPVCQTQLQSLENVSFAMLAKQHVHLPQLLSLRINGDIAKDAPQYMTSVLQSAGMTALQRLNYYAPPKSAAMLLLDDSILEQLSVCLPSLRHFALPFAPETWEGALQHPRLLHVASEVSIMPESWYRTAARSCTTSRTLPTRLRRVFLCF